MKKILISIMFLMATGAAWSGNYLTANLDYDPGLEKVVWKPFYNTDAGTYYRLFVYDDDGSLLWKGPRTRNEDSPYFVASLDYGVSFPQLLMDIDDDGRAELLIPALQSDVSTTWYHRLKWVGRTFKPMRNAVLEFYFGTHNDRVVWTTHPHKPYTYWASELHKMPNGVIRAQITGYDSTDPGTPHTGIALIRPAGNGGAVYDWIRPIQRPVIDEGYGENYVSTSGMSTPYSSAPHHSQGPQVPPVSYGNDAYNNKIQYTARLSWLDHFNSHGVRLRHIKEVLRQDRANYYRTHADSEDENDGYFTSMRRRAEIEHYRIVPVDMDYRSFRELILNGTPLIQASIVDGKMYVRILQP